jgi:Tfp pilus assembly protein PilW
MRGFSLAELLIALTVTLLLGGAIAGLARPARAAFDLLPAKLDIEQRGRVAIGVLSDAVRAAGRNVVAADLRGPLSGRLPVVSGTDPDGSGAYASMTVLVPATDPAQGVLSEDQATAAGPIALAVTPCPTVKDVCGFTPGTAVAIADDAGQFDVFIVATTSAGTRRLTADRLLSAAYPAGSMVVEVERSTFSLSEQPDGSYSLIRTTAAGAVQPIVDFVSSLRFSIQPHRVDVALSVQGPTDQLRRALSDRVFRTTVHLRNVHE